MIGEDVDAFAGEVRRPGLIGRNAGGGATERFANLEVVDVRWRTAVIVLHAKHHGDCFVYGKVGDPCVPTAPGGEGSDGKGKIRGHLTAEGNEQIAVEGALRTCGIEVDLQGGDAGLAHGGKDRLNGIVAVFIIEDCRCWRFDADHGDARRRSRKDEGIATRLRMHREPDSQSLVEIGDGVATRIDGAKDLRGVPRPRG